METKLKKNKNSNSNLQISELQRKSRIKGILIGTILSGIIFGSIGVAAVTLTADQIKYIPSNENFKANNAKEALDEIYKIAEYEIPSDTYFYDSSTSGDDIVRYKKVDGKYYLCDENGGVTDNTVQDISSIILTEYTSSTSSSLAGGNAAYSNGSLVLGNGNSGGKIKKYVFEGQYSKNNGGIKGNGTIEITSVPGYENLTIENMDIGYYQLNANNVMYAQVSITSYDAENGIVNTYYNNNTEYGHGAYYRLNVYVVE